MLRQLICMRPNKPHTRIELYTGQRFFGTMGKLLFWRYAVAAAVTAFGSTDTTVHWAVQGLSFANFCQIPGLVS